MLGNRCDISGVGLKDKIFFRQAFQAAGQQAQAVTVAEVKGDRGVVSTVAHGGGGQQVVKVVDAVYIQNDSIIAEQIEVSDTISTITSVVNKRIVAAGAVECIPTSTTGKNIVAVAAS